MIKGNDIVTLEKQNGEKIENIRALVQPNKIFIEDDSLPIEEGDIFIRKLNNGLIERYVVLDRGFRSGGYGFKAHYQCKVEKETTRELEQPKQVIYNIQGNNARININSHDNSTNVINTTSEDLFSELKKVLIGNIQEQDQRDQLIRLVEEMKDNVGTNKFISAYQNFIQNAANHMTLISPFIPALTQLFHQ